jgi:hypothetical protein
MSAASRLEKSEQLVSVATHSPATTPEAVRNRREERAESMACTSILIQKSIQRAQLDDGPGLSRLFGLFGLSGLFGLNTRIDQFFDEIDQTDRIDHVSRRR